MPAGGTSPDVIIVLPMANNVVQFLLFCRGRVSPPGCIENRDG